MAKRYCGGNPALLGKYLSMRGGDARMIGAKDTCPPRQPGAAMDGRYPVTDLDVWRPWLAAYQDDFYGWRTFGQCAFANARQLIDWLYAYVYAGAAAEVGAEGGVDG